MEVIEMIKRRRRKGARKDFIIDEKLAELVGVYIGDGTLTKDTIRISGDCRYDEPYFEYISKLVKEVLGFEPKIRKDPRLEKHLMYLDIYSKYFCEFLMKELKLKYGSKIRNKTTIPEQILSNEKFLLACLRGLVDTDGCVSRDGKTFSIRFGSHNKELLDQVERIGKTVGVFTFRTKKESGTRRWENIKYYFEVIGSSNLRHVVRYCEYFKGNPVWKRDVLKYYGQYKDVALPFKFKMGP